MYDRMCGLCHKSFDDPKAFHDDCLTVNEWDQEGYIVYLQPVKATGYVESIVQYFELKEKVANPSG